MLAVSACFSHMLCALMHLLKCQLHAVMKEACQHAEAAFRMGGTPLVAVVAAITVLEVSPSTLQPDNRWESLLSWSVSPRALRSGFISIASAPEITLITLQCLEVNLAADRPDGVLMSMPCPRDCLGMCAQEPALAGVHAGTTRILLMIISVPAARRAGFRDL